MGEDKLIDQTKLAEDVSNKIHLEMLDTFLVKPLEVEKVKKEFTKLPQKAPTTDENGIEAVEIEENEVETEIKEVDSDYRKGVVLKVPASYKSQMKDDKYPSYPIHVGDVIVYEARNAKYYDLLKDTQLVKQYAIIAVVNEYTEGVQQDSEAAE